MKKHFASLIPKVGQVVEVTVGDFIMEARVKYRYTHPRSQQIVLDVTHTSSSSLPVELVYHDDSWKVSVPEKCPFYGIEVSVNVLE